MDIELIISIKWIWEIFMKDLIKVLILFIIDTYELQNLINYRLFNSYDGYN